jgi:hypothetical protein
VPGADVLNSRAVRVFVTAEVLVCFVPLVGMLFLGFLFAPFAVLEMLKGRFQSVLYLLAVVCGVAGLIALVQVLKWLFGHQADRLGRRWTLALMLLGLLPIAVIFVDAVEAVVFDRESAWYTLLVPAVPVLVTAHLAYLAREYLFASTESRVDH